MFESFGYKHGIPGDADFVFDVRSLPNPYWEHALRHLTGRDAGGRGVSGEAMPSVRSMIAGSHRIPGARIAEFAQANRSYLTIAVGCTGGQHRSVYIAERLAEHFRQTYPNPIRTVLTRHDSLQDLDSKSGARCAASQRTCARIRASSAKKFPNFVAHRLEPKAINSRV
jgi:UPF0042 nucleotide-binding protein